MGNDRAAALHGLAKDPLLGVRIRPVNAGQAFFAHYEMLPFGDGDGVRFLTEYGQYTVPVNNTDLFYAYEGLTDDGQHWVSAIFPITLPSLPATADDALGGQTWEQFSAVYDQYLSGAVAQLDGQAPGAFAPCLVALDSLVSTISVAP